LLDYVFAKIPFTGDLNENQTVLKFVFNIYVQNPEKIQKYMENITLTCLKVLVDEKCDDIPEIFKKEVG